jgi:hypothetical protein
MSEHAIQNAKEWLKDITDLADRLGDADRHIRESAAREVEESPLSIQVRDGWRMLGESPRRSAEEFEVLLSMGGPALRIRGGFDAYGGPCDAELQWQDWGTPWTHYPTNPTEDAAISAFLAVFAFAEYEEG